MGPRLPKHVLNVLLIVLGLVGALIVVEVMIRKVVPQGIYSLPARTYEFDPVTGYRLIPNHTFVKVTPDYRMVIRTNSRGLRDREHGEVGERFRILGLGDSYTFGYGLPVEQSYLALLETALDGCNGGKGVDVIKAGVPGYATRQQLAYLKSEGIRYRPNLVIVGFLINNDTVGNVKQDPIVVDGILIRADRVRPTYGVKDPSRGLRLKYFLRSFSHTYVFVADNLKLTFGPLLKKIGLVAEELPILWDARLEMQGFLKVPTSEFERAWGVTKSLFVEMHEFLKAKGVNLVIVAIAMDLEYNPALRAKYLRQLGWSEADLDLQRPHRLLREFAESRGIPLLDLRAPFERRAGGGQPLRFRFDGHWNADGHRLAADELHRFVASRKLVPCKG